MKSPIVERDEFMAESGQCFMYVLWSETTMRDLIVLQEGGTEMRRRYSEAFGRGPHPSDFSRKRAKLGKMDFADLKERFLEHWPHWKQNREIWDALERLVLWRNGLGHANVQPFRGYHLYTPRDASWKRIDAHMRCGQCFKYHGCCACGQEELAQPPTLIVRSQTLKTIYEDIRTVDVRCFYPTALSLNVAYSGVAWPNEEGEYTIKSNRLSGD